MLFFVESRHGKNGSAFRRQSVVQWSVLNAYLGSRHLFPSSCLRGKHIVPSNMADNEEEALQEVLKSLGIV